MMKCASCNAVHPGDHCDDSHSYIVVNDGCPYCMSASVRHQSLARCGKRFITSFTCGSKYIILHYVGEDRLVATVYRSPYCIALEDDASREDTI